MCIRDSRYVGVDLDDVVQRPALGLDQRLDGLERFARLALEITATRRPAVLVVGHLAGDEQDRLGLRHLHALAIGRWIEYSGRAVPLDLRHGCVSPRESDS